MAQLPPNPPFNCPSIPSSPPSPSDISADLYAADLYAWIDELIDFSACTQAPHRRAFSDTIAGFEPLVAAANPTMLPAPPSDNNNVNEDNNKPNINPPDCYPQPDQPIHHLHSEAENSSVNNIPQLPVQDPKKVKRILANRQSARRSRERKLQYTSDLQKCVGKFETEVATLKPRVAYLDCQRSMLVAQNSQLKHRIALLAQDKIIKDACQESLKREIGRLSQIYQRQNLTQTNAVMGAIEAGGEGTATIFYQNDFA